MFRIAFRVACFAPVALLARDPLPAPEIPAPLGVNIHFTRGAPGEVDLLAATGFRIVRMDFTWGGVERQVGTYDFSAYDRLVADMDARGVRILFILDYGHPVHTKGNGPATDAERAAFVAFARAGARHFKGRKILWEVWNEPNIPQFWKPAPDVEAYAKLAVAVARAVKEEDPEALVLAPATSTIDLRFLEGCFRRGLLESIDVVTIHPYRGAGPETMERELVELRALMARCGGRLLPIANGEWGYSAVNVPLQTQADYLARQALFGLSMGFAFNIWYDWRDDGLDPKEPEHHFGSVYRDLAPKPASIAMKALAETLAGFAFVTRLPIAQGDAVALLFARGAEERVAAWSTGGERAIAIPVGRATIVSRDGARTEVADCRELAVTSAPIYVIPRERSEALAFERVLAPCERWLAARAGEPLAAAFVLRNPFERTLRLRVRTDLDDAAPRDVVLAAGAEERFEVPCAVRDRARQVQEVRVRVHTEDGKLRAAATAHIVVRNALRVRILPPERGALPVEIAVADRSPFKGEISAREGGRRTGRNETDGSGARADRRVSLALPEGHDTTIVRIPAPPASGAGDGGAFTGEPRRWRVEVSDERGATVLETAARFVRAFAFAAEPEKPVADLRLIMDDGDRNVPLAATLEGCAGRDGGPGARLRYEFGDGWRFLPIAPAGGAAIEGEPARMHVWIHGDGSGDYLRCRFVDATGQTFQPDGGRVDFKGWKLVEFPLRGNFGFWGGAKDGIIHYPIRWNAVLLVDSAARTRHKGEIIIGEAALVHDDERG